MVQLGGMNQLSGISKAFEEVLKVYGEGRQAQCLSLNVPRKEKWLVLSTKRQVAVARANSASIHVGILVISEAAERHFWISCSTVLYSDSLGAGKCSKSFIRGIQQPKAPSCPLPLSCSQIMHKVRV